MEASKGQKAAADCHALVANIFQSESFIYGLNFKPKPGDVILSAAHKSGTTWTQQILHSLRSNGHTDFEELSLVIPELELAEYYNPGALDGPQLFEPRIFKTHFEYHQCPKGASKYVVVVRESTDAAVSYFHHIINWVYRNESENALEEFVESIYLPLNLPEPPTTKRYVSQMNHIAGWYPHRLDENVLWIHYEDLKEDIRGMVKRISEFLDIGVGDEALLDLVVEQASFENMKKHSSKYDEHIMKRKLNKELGFPEEWGVTNNSGRVRSGKTGGAKAVLSQEMIDKIYQRWREILTPVTGYETYAEMRAAINKELGRELGSK